MSLKKQFLKSRPECKVTFSLPSTAAPGANVVKLVGDFNDWNAAKGVPMVLKNDEYSIIIELETNREYQFRYLIDNEKWENDWQADEYMRTPFGCDNSVVNTYQDELETIA